MTTQRIFVPPLESDEPGVEVVTSADVDASDAGLPAAFRSANTQAELNRLLAQGSGGGTGTGSNPYYYWQQIEAVLGSTTSFSLPTTGNPTFVDIPLLPKTNSAGGLLNDRDFVTDPEGVFEFDFMNSVDAAILRFELRFTHHFEDVPGTGRPTTNLVSSARHFTLVVTNGHHAFPLSVFGSHVRLTNTLSDFVVPVSAVIRVTSRNVSTGMQEAANLTNVDYEEARFTFWQLASGSQVDFASALEAHRAIEDAHHARPTSLDEFVTGTRVANYVPTVQADGTVAYQAQQGSGSGTGDITAVNTQAPLAGGGDSGAINLRLPEGTPSQDGYITKERVEKLDAYPPAGELITRGHESDGYAQFQAAGVYNTQTDKRGKFSFSTNATGGFSAANAAPWTDLRTGQNVALVQGATRYAAPAGAFNSPDTAGDWQIGTVVHVRDWHEADENRSVTFILTSGGSASGAGNLAELSARARVVVGSAGLPDANATWYLLTEQPNNSITIADIGDFPPYYKGLWVSGARYNIADEVRYQVGVGDFRLYKALDAGASGSTTAPNLNTSWLELGNNESVEQVRATAPLVSNSTADHEYTVGFNAPYIKEDWDAAEAYREGDIAKDPSNGRWYICDLTQIAGQDPPRSNNAWRQIDGGGTGGGSSSFKGAWTTRTAYAVGDVVSYQGGIYRCIAARTTSSTTAPDADMTGWDQSIYRSDVVGGQDTFVGVYPDQNTLNMYQGLAFGNGTQGYFAIMPAATGAPTSASSFYRTLSAVQAGNRQIVVNQVMLNHAQGFRSVSEALAEALDAITPHGGPPLTLTGVGDAVPWQGTHGGTRNLCWRFPATIAIGTGTIPGGSVTVDFHGTDPTGELFKFPQSAVEDLIGDQREQDRLIEANTQAIATNTASRVTANPTVPSGATKLGGLQVGTGVFDVLQESDFNPHADWYGEYSDAHLSDPAGLWTLDDAAGRSKQGYFSFHATKPTVANATTTAPIAPDRIETANGIWLNLHLNQFNLNYGNVNQAYVTLTSADFETGDVITFRNRNTATVYVFTVTGNYETQNDGLRANLRNSVAQGNLVRSGPQTELLVARVSDQLHRSFPVHVLPTETGIVDPTTNEVFPNLIPPAGRAAEPAAPASGTVNYLQRLVRSTTGSVVSWVNENIFQRAIQYPDPSATPPVPDTRLPPSAIKGLGGSVIAAHVDNRLGEIVLTHADGVETTVRLPDAIRDQVNFRTAARPPTMADAPARGEDPFFLELVVPPAVEPTPKRWGTAPVGMEALYVDPDVIAEFRRGWRRARISDSSTGQTIGGNTVYGNWTRWPNINPDLTGITSNPPTSSNTGQSTEQLMAYQAVTEVSNTASDKQVYDASCIVHLDTYYYKTQELQQPFGSYFGKRICGIETTNHIYPVGDATQPTEDRRIAELLIRDTSGANAVARYYRIEHIPGSRATIPFQMVEQKHDTRFYTQQAPGNTTAVLWVWTNGKWNKIPIKDSRLIASVNVAGKSTGTTGSGTTSTRNGVITITAAGTALGYTQFTDGSGNVNNNLMVPYGGTEDLAYLEIRVFWGTTEVARRRMNPYQVVNDAAANAPMTCYFQRPGVTGNTGRVNLHATVWPRFGDGNTRNMGLYFNHVSSLGAATNWPPSSKIEIYAVID